MNVDVKIPVRFELYTKYLSWGWRRVFRTLGMQKGDFSHAYYDQEKQHAPCVVLHSRLIMILYNLKSMNMVVGNQLTVSLRLIKPFDYFRIDLTATLSFRSSLY